MNISRPIASYVGSVDFGFLSSEEIKALSVKRIQNPTTFDTLLNPVPGGLYDAALGAWSDNVCATCHQNTFSCPGHPGHIELPVPVYHVTFMEQLLRLLRARCAYCSHLRLPRAEVNRYICKLRLIQYGLTNEAEELENIQLQPKSIRNSRADAAAMDQGESDTSEDDAEDIIQRRNLFMKKAIKKSGGKKQIAEAEKINAISEARRAVIKEFLGAITKARACGNCQGISPSFRKDKFTKFFSVALSKTLQAKMVQGGFNAANPFIIASMERQAAKKQQREDREIDEGIVADLDDISEEQEEDDEAESFELEQDNINSNHVDENVSTVKSKPKEDEKGKQTYINPQEVFASIEQLFQKETEIFNLVYNARYGLRDAESVSPNMFFIRHLLVPPNKYRPEARTSAGEIAEAQEHSIYKQILIQCDMMHQIRLEISGNATGSTRRRDFNDLQNAWVRLQEAVNSLLDSDRNPVQGAAAKQNPDGIRQKLEKKEGLFRMNMMGKRVNFAARSVISPDPNIETNEIGVPPVFAKKLTYPEPVTNHNFYDLKEAVLNGVDKWPGAAAVENENGQVINLKAKNFEERQALANQLLAPSSTSVTGARNKKVHRHLNNGDIVLMNRQPTLHKPSIMGHRTRVLPGEKTLRMHYANCNTYNADFDGDEMNMHFPQNEVARSEALQIADTDHQYLVATSGKPLRGLIQDHISMGLWLTNRDTLFDRDDYQQLLYSSLRPENNHTTSGRIETISPAIIKPQAMWTGKQVVTTALKNVTPASHPGLTLLGKSQTTKDRWGEDSEEADVIFKDGELLCGILDKAHLGPSGGGFIHSIYETYGHTIAGKLLGVLGRLLTKVLHMRAFSCGIEDLILTREGDRIRREKIQEVETIGLEVATKYVTLKAKPDANNPELRTRLEGVLRDDEKQAGLDAVYNSRTAILSSEITTACLPIGLQKPFPRNQMQAMTASGAKGTSVNANLITCNLGQQNLEGRRVPIMVSGKTLPSFKPFETKVRAGGYITDRFLSGVKPQEYYFHAMAGREGLIDTAVKTSRSGYLQRCLIKGMEGLRVEYDTSVRDSDGSMVQFLYGEDGLDVTKQKHLTNFKFLAENYLSLVAQLNVRDEFQKIVNDEAGEWHKSAMKKVRKTGNINAMDPVLTMFNPGSTMGSTSETFALALKEYCEANPELLLKDKKKAPNAAISKKTFNALLDMKYMKSVVDPGEAVGIVAGQSVGEPSTQMTLNTFHLAGHSARNVTLGIPRLREIVMTASKTISTPTMTLHLIPEINEATAEKFAKGITKLTLAEVIDNVIVKTEIGKGSAYTSAKMYEIRINFFPSSEYQEAYAISNWDVVRTIENKFIPLLCQTVRKELKMKGSGISNDSAAKPEIGKSVGVVADVPSRAEVEREGGDEDEDDEADDDATNTKQRQNRDEAISYEEPDEAEEAIVRDAQRISTPDQELEDEGFVGSPRQAGSDGDDAKEDQDNVHNGTAKEREARIMENYSDLIRFSFDDKNGAWCEVQLEYDVSTAKILMLNLVESACRNAVIQAIPGLGACTFNKNLNVIESEGVNLLAMHDYQHILDPHKIFTNDIEAMRTIYGVEACRATIIREMDAVFKGHGIAVDNRHLNLIADVMTKEGGFTPFNRMGMAGSVSPFMKMSFETTMNVLRDAVLDGDWDDLKGPSARIVMGKVGKVGTGVFDVLTPVN